MLNNSGPRYKRSQLEQQMNYDVIWYVYKFGIEISRSQPKSKISSYQ